MLYGMETVAMTEKQVGKMEVAELKMVRWALDVTRKHKVNNKHRWAQPAQNLAPLTASPIIKKISFAIANPITRIFRLRKLTLVR